MMNLLASHTRTCACGSTTTRPAETAVAGGSPSVTISHVTSLPRTTAADGSAAYWSRGAFTTVLSFWDKVLNCTHSIDNLIYSVWSTTPDMCRSYLNLPESIRAQPNKSSPASGSTGYMTTSCYDINSLHHPVYNNHNPKCNKSH